MNLKFWTWDLWKWFLPQPGGWWFDKQSYLRTIDRLELSVKDLARERDGERALREANIVELVELATLRRNISATEQAAEKWQQQFLDEHALVLKLGSQLSTLNSQLSARGVLRSLAKHPLPKPELLETLKLVDEETPWWRALHAALNERERITSGAVTEAGISSEEAHFRRGRLSEIQASRDEWLGWHAEVHHAEEG